MSNYVFDYRTTGTSDSELQGSVYWYNSGVESRGIPYFYDTSNTYALFQLSGGEWRINTIAEIGESPTNYYEQAIPGSGVLAGNGTWTGTIGSPIGDNISDAWYRAETTVFESLRSFLQCTENRECFRGFLPIQGDLLDYKYVNVWSINSGGSSVFDIERLQGSSGNWCSLRVDATIESLWAERKDAMRFAGAVKAWLEHTGNMSQIENVTYCSLAEIPAEPEEVLTDGRNRKRYWKQEVLLEIVYRTVDEY